MTGEPYKLNIGDKLYRYVSFGGVWSYTVEGIHQYKDMTNYSLKCNTCRDHASCYVSVGFVKDKLRFLQCENNRGDSWDEDDQTYWHTNFDEEYFFYRYKEEALLEVIRCNIKYKEKEVEKAEKRLAEEKKGLEKYLNDKSNYEQILKDLLKDKGVLPL